MVDLVLYHFPNACSQVTLFALDAAKADYEVRLVNLIKKEQDTEAYLNVSPLGKVPLLLVDGVPLMENAAMLTYLGEAYPEAGLFPADRTALGVARRVSGLGFCASTLHPIVRGILNPARLTDGDGAPVRSRSVALALKSFAFAEQQLAESGWWFASMSVIDVYLNWTITVARKGGFDMAAFPKLDGLKNRLMTHPSFAGRWRKRWTSPPSLASPKEAEHAAAGDRSGRIVVTYRPPRRLTVSQLHVSAQWLAGHAPRGGLQVE